MTLEAEGPVELRHSARRVKMISDHMRATKYLEVGVAGGKTLFTVDIAQRTAVDPRFRFDKAEKAAPGLQLFEMTSDEWFLKHSHGQVFDIIFLDGLHTFEQTFRDFCNSLSVAHSNTVWIIDDTVPSDYYSAWPDQRPAVAQRQADFRREKISGAWHGDVYKVIFAIHDFFPLLSYCTATTTGNPQTIIWRQPRLDFQPKYNNLETISRLNFMDFRREFDLMRPKSESKAMEEVLSRTMTPIA